MTVEKIAYRGLPFAPAAVEEALVKPTSITGSEGRKAIPIAWEEIKEENPKKTQL